MLFHRQRPAQRKQSHCFYALELCGGRLRFIGLRRVKQAEQICQSLIGLRDARAVVCERHGARDTTEQRKRADDE